MSEIDSVLIVAVLIGLLLLAVCAGWPLGYGVALCAYLWRTL